MKSVKTGKDLEGVTGKKEEREGEKRGNREEEREIGEKRGKLSLVCFTKKRSQKKEEKFQGGGEIFLGGHNIF